MKTSGRSSSRVGRVKSPTTRSRIRRLQLELGERSYTIHLGVGTLARAGAEIARRTRARRVALVTSPSIGRHCAGLLARSLRDAGVRPHRIEVPDGDRAKSLNQLSRLYGAFLDAGLDRSSAVVALGGGAVGDLAGFAAATFLRGIPVVQVPTTLLAMVDSSVGGKTAVNLARGKNLVGVFHQPSLVWIDVATLKTLPERQFAAGMAEVIKHAAILDRGLFELLEQELDAVLALEPRILLSVIERACAVKLDVVRQDEKEHGVRTLLNFGHTLGHAVEALSGYGKVLHGEAVSIGMGFAARRSEALGLAPSGTAERLEALLRRTGLPTALPAYSRSAYLRAVGVDKKKRDARIRYVVLREIGRADTRMLTPAEVLGRPAAARERRGRCPTKSSG